MNWIAKNYGFIIVGTLLILMMVIAIYLKGKGDANDGSFYCRFFGLGCPTENEPSNGSANPGSANVPDISAPQANTTIIALSNRLSQYINETVFFDTSFRCVAYADSLQLSDGDFKALANYFKSTNANTLREAINTTYYGCNNFVGTDPKDLVLIRLDALNIP